MTLCMIFGRVNPYVNIYVHTVNRLVANLAEEVHICIIVGRTPRNGNVHHYNVLTINEVAMIILGESKEVGNRDVIV